ncbi:MAG: SGNH/GDSL hydrolase family protein [Acidimicrobiales bacterium]|nr:SGNH/GDSL hydrolase family protein [Acidimicrobiales bacterium]
MTIPPLRREQRFFSLSKLGGVVSDGIAAVNSTIEPRAQYWDEWNRETHSAEGPLWVALGDSVTQGIGSTNPSTSYVSIVLNRLNMRTGLKWRLVNLSMSGGRFADVTNYQLPTMEQALLKPDLVTAIIGSNDVMWRRNSPDICKDAERMVQDLPSGTFLSRVSGSQKKGRRAQINSVFEESSTAKDINLFSAWDWPTGKEMWAEDRFHPNDRAYKYIANNLWRALFENRRF